jgi:hypothetical protein
MGAFAAAPNERVLGPSLVSTLFPRLPRSHLGTFRIGLALGIGLVGGLTVAGLYPVALAVAAAIVPALIVVYVYAVDVYEDEPLAVLGATVLWGVVTGALFGVVSTGLATVTPGANATPADALLRGVVLPIIGGALALVGPLFLVRRPAFNDVLDGVIFGAASGSAFIGAQTLAGAGDLLSGGLRPVGAVGTWLVQLFTVGVAQPILSASVAAIVAGTVWLRVRAPTRDRAAMGRFSDPFVAIVLGGLLLAAAGLGRLLLAPLVGLPGIAALAILSLIWMRLLIHLGLMQEAAEIEIGDPITCPECGALTPYHTFCVKWGIARRALPRLRRPAEPVSEPEPSPPTSEPS